MPQETTPGTTERVSISCPGCGRHDTVNWARGAATYPWKCFNCEKEFELSRKQNH